MDPKNLNIIRETVLHITDPENGVPSHLEYDPQTYINWVDIFEETEGWIKAGIDDKEATIYNFLNIGEVIPNIAPNLDIFNSSCPVKRILVFLESNKREKKVILNYYSFVKLLKLMNTDDKEFRDQLYLFLKNINARTFWLNLCISDEKAEILEKHHIGQVTTMDGGNIFIPKDSKESSESDSDDEMNSDDKERKEIPSSFMIIFNNNTLKKLFKIACEVNGKVDTKINVYKHLLKYKDDDTLDSIFLKLQI